MDGSVSDARGKVVVRLKGQWNRWVHLSIHMCMWRCKYLCAYVDIDLLVYVYVCVCYCVCVYVYPLTGVVVI